MHLQLPWNKKGVIKPFTFRTSTLPHTVHAVTHDNIKYTNRQDASDKQAILGSCVVTAGRKFDHITPLQWRKYNFCPPGKHSLRARPKSTFEPLMLVQIDSRLNGKGSRQGWWFCEIRVHSLTVLIHNSGHFGPLYRFGPVGPQHCRGCRWLVTPLRRSYASSTGWTVWTACWSAFRHTCCVDSSLSWTGNSSSGEHERFSAPGTLQSPVQSSGTLYPQISDSYHTNCSYVCETLKSLLVFSPPFYACDDYLFCAT